MAFETPGFLFTRPAAADLSSKQYYAVKIDSDGKVNAVASAGYDFDGVSFLPVLPEHTALSYPGR